MFRHEGPGRSDFQNRILAGYLAFIGGFVALVLRMGDEPPEDDDGAVV